MEMWVKRGLVATIRGFTQNQPYVSSGRVRERDITRLSVSSQSYPAFGTKQRLPQLTLVSMMDLWLVIEAQFYGVSMSTVDKNTFECIFNSL